MKEKIDPNSIFETLKEIAELAQQGANEMAHFKEDNMFYNLVQAIADGDCTNPKVCCQLCMTSLDIDFVRECGYESV